jgi:hypothetical protein
MRTWKFDNEVTFKIPTPAVMSNKTFSEITRLLGPPPFSPRLGRLNFCDDMEGRDSDPFGGSPYADLQSEKITSDASAGFIARVAGEEGRVFFSGQYKVQYTITRKKNCRFMTVESFSKQGHVSDSSLRARGPARRESLSGPDCPSPVRLGATGAGCQNSDRIEAAR